MHYNHLYTYHTSKHPVYARPYIRPKRLLNTLLHVVRFVVGTPRM